MNSSVVAGALLLVAFAVGSASANEPVTIDGYDAEGRTVTVYLSNSSQSVQVVSVQVTVTQNGVAHRARARVRLPAQGNASPGLPLGTISEDINPLDIVVVEIM